MDRIFLAIVVLGLLLLAGAASLLVLSKENAIDPMDGISYLWRETIDMLRIPWLVVRQSATARKSA